jgi:hypothetical protein
MGNSFSNGNLFTPMVIQRALEGSGAVIGVDLENYSGSNITGSNSYVFDDPGSALKSTQQIPIDWSRFENHTFFNSAESKVNVSFDSIINYYPFDGTNDEIQIFLDGLSGYEKYLFDQFPKQVGYLLFSGTKVGEDPANGFAANLGTYIGVSDLAGTLYPSLSRTTSGENILDPGGKGISFQFFINIPPEAADNQIILQKLSTSTGTGLSVVLSASNATTGRVVFIASSGSNAMSASCDIPKNEFVHLTTYFDRNRSGLSRLKIFKTGSLLATSSNTATFNSMTWATEALYIGTGSAHNLGSLDDGYFIPQQTLSASLDDLRCYHGDRSQRKIKSDYLKDAYPTKPLKLYFKFNEASGSYVNNNVVLDSSGNSLHAHISNFNSSSRDYRMGTPPLPLERKAINPVLFPGHPDVISLNQRLLASASQYDNNNPNLITRLIPEHYLTESDLEQGFSDTFADTGADYAYNIDFPGGGRIGQPQIIASLLFTWAKFFDEIKLFIDQFGNLLKVDYDENGTVSDWMLPFFANYYGFVLPNNFSNATYGQYLLGENIGVDPTLSNKALFNVQTEIWRRILINLNGIIKSKGTVGAIKAVMRAAGINPDTMFRFREFGGSRTITTSDARRNRSEIASQLYVSSSTALVISPFLSASRTEPGFPFAANPVLPTRSDGLLTSGSWTYEGLYQFNFSFRGWGDTPVTQSLARMRTTGSTGVSQTGALLANLVAYGTGSAIHRTGSLELFVRPNSSDSAPTMQLVLTGVNVFDQNQWHISFGRDIGSATGSFATASYFVRASRAQNGEIAEYYSTASVFNLGTKDLDTFSRSGDDFNASGSYFEFGGGSPTITTTGNKFLNSSTVVTNNNARYYGLKAKMAAVRFWTLPLSEKETKEHTRNFKSVGVENPLINYNFVTNASGSWERLRINATVDQQVTESNSSGNISIFDFSQNEFSLTGSGFPVSKRTIHPKLFRYSILDPSFGERSAENKIRVRGFQNDINIEEFNTLKSPVRQIDPGQPTLDDPRFSIEVSAVGALNEDIVNILAGLDWLDSAIGNPELQFASDYPELRALREVYFHRLTDKVNFKNLFLFYKWFDDSLSIIIERLIPRTTKYMGINFVIESHFLERPKFRNMNSNIYLSASDRRDINDELLLAVISGVLKRF